MSAFEENSCTIPHELGLDSSVDDNPKAPGARSLRAAQRISALGEMTTGLAHDFRNILAVIQSAMNRAEENSGDSAKMKAAFGAVREGIGRGTSLTAKLLAFARPDRPDTQVENVNSLLENLELFLDYAAGPHIRVRLDLSPGLPPCRIDAAQFGAAILNLVINARDAMPEGGEIRIATNLIGLSETGDGNADAGSVVVRVIDQGEGMPREIRDHIFDPFFTTKGEIGTGLGVPQVASFMRGSGGCMNISSEPGSGTSVDLYFPIFDSPGLIGTNLWRQLDRWVNEGGQSSSPAIAGGSATLLHGH